MTKLYVPKHVASYLSMGPKFMLPSYSNFTCAAVNADFAQVLTSLNRLGNYEVMHEPMLRNLREAHRISMGVDYYVSRADQRMLFAAQAVEEFLQLHPDIMVVDGDKGKKTGLIYRNEFDTMCMGFLRNGVTSGQYVFHAQLRLDVYMAKLRAMYVDFIAKFNMYSGTRHLYMGLTSAQESIAAGRNAEVYHVLSSVEWVVPKFIPTVKYHKTPLTIRPVISKKGSASMSVGKVIVRALEQMR